MSHSAPNGDLGDGVFEAFVGLAMADFDDGLSPTEPHLDSGALRLSLAVLEDAMRCAIRHHGSRNRQQREAAREALSWIQSDAADFPFAFVNICDALRLEPDWIRWLVTRRLSEQDERRRAA